MATKKQIMKVLPALLAANAVGAGKRRRGRKMRGAGFFGDLWSGVKSVGSAIASPVNDLLKATKVISTLAPMVPIVGSTAGKVAGALGYGRKRRVRRKMGGMAAHMMTPSHMGGLAAHIVPPFYGAGKRKRKAAPRRKTRGAGQVLNF